MKLPKYLLTIVALPACFQSFAQSFLNTAGEDISLNNSEIQHIDSVKQKDITDLFPWNPDRKASNRQKMPGNTFYSLVPYAGYTLSTGFAVDLNTNVSFYTSPARTQNMSVVATDISYDSKSQAVFLTRSEIWAKDNNYKIVSDVRWERYPIDTYGLGTFTTFATNNNLDFNYLRVYGTVLKKIASDYYAGIGYNLDYHYNIYASGNSDNSVSDFTKYGQTDNSASSGLNVNFLYDNRKNPLNPLPGGYASVIYRQNLTALGSDANWRSLQFDLRKYFKLSSRSNSILAFWGMATFTSGNVPYLDLPVTGGDMYNNSGRGYAIGRYRGTNMLYLEAEYRFGITRNGLLGGVVFTNGQSFSEYNSNRFAMIAPAAGTGIRIKLNKHSNTNIGIDYGVGVMGSHGFFVNLGEVF
jgi:outer membrane protein assembly factor BamA